MVFKLLHIPKTLFQKNKKPDSTLKPHISPKALEEKYYDFCATSSLLKENGFFYKDTNQRLSDLSDDKKRLDPILEAIPLEFKKKFGKDIPPIPSQEETRKIAKMVIKKLDKTYGPYDDRFVIAEDKKENGERLTKREQKRINDRHPPNYPLKDIPKKQFACFETSILTSYILRKLTKLEPEILFFIGRSTTKTHTEKVDHALVVLPEYNMLLETTDPKTKPTIQNHDFKQELKENGNTKLFFDDSFYEIPPPDLTLKDKFRNSFKNALGTIHNAQSSLFNQIIDPMAERLKILVDKIMKG